ncbi:MAG: restriction endonuclease [Nitrospira sp.]|nr:restriction endonuclease [Nitrospira sp.]
MALLAAALLSGNFILFSCLALPLLIAILWKVTKKERQKNDRAQWESEQKLKLLHSIRKHGPTLYRKFQQASWIDDYGVHQKEKGEAEIQYFLKTVLVLDQYDPLFDWAYEHIREQMNTAISDKSPQTEDIDIEAMEPLEFEHHCARILSQHGWKAYATKGSGDQGTDVIAERDGLRVVIQCKLYSKPVGNSAVQEINAGRIFEQAHIACVVTNTTFTQSARRLAQATGVLLLHCGDLPHLSARIHELKTFDPSLQKV